MLNDLSHSINLLSNQGVSVGITNLRLIQIRGGGGIDLAHRQPCWYNEFSRFLAGNMTPKIAKKRVFCKFYQQHTDAIDAMASVCCW